MIPQSNFTAKIPIAIVAFVVDQDWLHLLHVKLATHFGILCGDLSQMRFGHSFFFTWISWIVKLKTLSTLRARNLLPCTPSPYVRSVNTSTVGWYSLVGTGIWNLEADPSFIRYRNPKSAAAGLFFFFSYFHFSPIHPAERRAHLASAALRYKCKIENACVYYFYYSSPSR